MIQEIRVRVEIETSTDVHEALVEIVLEPGQRIRTQDFTDACQRAVAQCVEQLEQHFQAEKSS